VSVVKDIESFNLDRVYLGPGFEVDNMPVVFYNGKNNEIKSHDL
jgi:hypothetical protein